MRTLICSLTVCLTMTVACSKDRQDADPCAKAVENTRRLVVDDPVARVKFGAEPLTLERCHAAQLSSRELECLGYASTWGELAACSPVALRVERDHSEVPRF